MVHFRCIDHKLTLTLKTGYIFYGCKLPGIMRQGQFMINTSEMDHSTTMVTISDDICDDGITIQK